MSVRITELTKIYGSQKALDQVSFEANTGEILGFLGPNGAGKSTTMKIATGYIPPTEGSVIVAGHDVNEDSLKVRQSVGYLPEHNPLYLDMYVHEYLGFMSDLHNIPSKSRKERVGKMIELCGLQVEQNKKIGALSKGYRQRVGLAQALIHDPEVLILDEPTTGLDPNQIIEVREVIRSISKEKTVIFSTHILQEVKALCDRVVIIDKGRIVADNKVDSLLSESQGQSIEVEFSESVSIEALEEINGVTSVQDHGAKVYRISSASDQDIRKDLFDFAAGNRITLLGMNQVEESMEDIFRKLTKETDEE